MWHFSCDYTWEELERMINPKNNNLQIYDKRYFIVSRENLPIFYVSKD